MVLESTLICLDNSDWMRNGDYTPTRLDAQYDAASLVCNDRTTSNPENTVGIISMAGQGVELLVSPTEDIGKILACFNKIKLGGSADFGTTVQIAQLALKHRKNKNGGQRIIAFVGSPLLENPERLTKIGKQLKKNNVAVDVINLGEIEHNQEKLNAFIEAVNSNDNSHLINVPPGISPADALLSSPILQDSPFAGMASGSTTAGGVSASGGANFDEYGGIDPSMDPELAMAIRVSVEEARAFEEARARTALEESNPNQNDASSSAAADSSASIIEDDDELLMQRALELSMRETTEQRETTEHLSASNTSQSLSDSLLQDEVIQTLRDNNQNDEDEYDDMNEDEALRRALELSMVSSPIESEQLLQNATIATSSVSAEGIDQDFLSALLSANDVDMNDPLVQAALAQLTGTNIPNDIQSQNANKKRKNEDNDNN